MEMPSSPIVESSATVLDIEGLEPISGTGTNPNNSHDVHIIYLISQGIQAYDFVSRKFHFFHLFSASNFLGIICFS